MPASGFGSSASAYESVSFLRSGAGVEIVPTYDRSELIQRSVSNLTGKLIEEFVVVALVCFAFLFHLRSASSGASSSLR